MELATVITALTEIKNGQMARVEYRSEVPVKAAYKKQGVQVIKLTSATVRFGVDYDHIQRVIDRKASQPEDIVTNARNTAYSWVMKDKLSFNTNTNKHYIRFATLPAGANKYVTYIVIKDGQVTQASEVADESIKEFVINSYWNGNSPEVQNVCIDNVIKINDRS